MLLSSWSEFVILVNWVPFVNAEQGRPSKMFSYLTSLSLRYLSMQNEVMCHRGCLRGFPRHSTRTSSLSCCCASPLIGGKSPVSEKEHAPFGKGPMHSICFWYCEVDCKSLHAVKLYAIKLLFVPRKPYFWFLGTCRGTWRLSDSEIDSVWDNGKEALLKLPS